MTSLRLTQPQLELVTELVGTHLGQQLIRAEEWTQEDWDKAQAVAQLWDYLRERESVNAHQ